jgi:hypothetical protein
MELNPASPFSQNAQVLEPLASNIEKTVEEPHRDRSTSIMDDLKLLKELNGDKMDLTEFSQTNPLDGTARSIYIDAPVVPLSSARTNGRRVNSDHYSTTANTPATAKRHVHSRLKSCENCE